MLNWDWTLADKSRISQTEGCVRLSLVIFFWKLSWKWKSVPSASNASSQMWIRNIIKFKNVRFFLFSASSAASVGMGLSHCLCVYCFTSTFWKCQHISTYYQNKSLEVMWPRLKGNARAYFMFFNWIAWDPDFMSSKSHFVEKFMALTNMSHFSFITWYQSGEIDIQQ